MGLKALKIEYILFVKDNRSLQVISKRVFEEFPCQLVNSSTCQLKQIFTTKSLILAQDER